MDADYLLAVLFEDGVAGIGLLIQPDAEQVAESGMVPQLLAGAVSNLVEEEAEHLGGFRQGYFLLDIDAQLFDDPPDFAFTADEAKVVLAEILNTFEETVMHSAVLLEQEDYEFEILFVEADIYLGVEFFLARLHRFLLLLDGLHFRCRGLMVLEGFLVASGAAAQSVRNELHFLLLCCFLGEVLVDQVEYCIGDDDACKQVLNFLI